MPDDTSASEVPETSTRLGQDEKTLLRTAIRAGLPLLADCFQPPRPKGCFTEACQKMAAERIAFEEAMASEPQTPER